MSYFEDYDVDEYVDVVREDRDCGPTDDGTLVLSRLAVEYAANSLVVEIEFSATKETCRGAQLAFGPDWDQTLLLS